MIVQDASCGRGGGAGPIKGVMGRRDQATDPPPAPGAADQSLQSTGAGAPRRPIIASRAVAGRAGHPSGPQRRAGGAVDARSLSGAVGVVCYAFETVSRSSSCPWWSCFPSRSAGSSVPGSAARPASVASARRSAGNYRAGCPQPHRAARRTGASKNALAAPERFQPAASIRRPEPTAGP